MAKNASLAADNPKWFESREKNPRVGIAVSCFGQLPPPFVASFTEVVRAAMFEGVVVDTVFDATKPLDRSRNLCVKALLKKEPDYVFFMDSDMVFKPNTLLELIRQDKDIISGVYCYKRPPHPPVLSLIDAGGSQTYKIMDYPRGKLFKVDGCGAGCLLVKSKVFRAVEEPWFKMRMGLSEDLYFGLKAAKSGFEIWADGGVECGHLSEYISIEPESFWKRRDRIREDMEKVAQFNDGRIPAYKDYKGDAEERK